MAVDAIVGVHELETVGQTENADELRRSRNVVRSIRPTRQIWGAKLESEIPIYYKFKCIQQMRLVHFLTI